MPRFMPIDQKCILEYFFIMISAYFHRKIIPLFTEQSKDFFNIDDMTFTLTSSISNNTLNITLEVNNTTHTIGICANTITLDGKSKEPYTTSNFDQVYISSTDLLVNGLTFVLELEFKSDDFTFLEHTAFLSPFEQNLGFSAFSSVFPEHLHSSQFPKPKLTRHKQVFPSTP